MKNLYVVLFVLSLMMGNLSAQPKGGQIDFAPAIGYYISTANVIEEGIGTSLAVEANHKSSLAFGGKLTIWANNMLGFESSFAYSSADLEGAVGGVEGTIGASLFFASEKVVLGFGNTSRFQIGGHSETNTPYIPLNPSRSVSVGRDFCSITSQIYRRFSQFSLTGHSCYYLTLLNLKV